MQKGQRRTARTGHAIAVRLALYWSTQVGALCLQMPAMRTCSNAQSNRACNRHDRHADRGDRHGRDQRAWRSQLAHRIAVMQCSICLYIGTNMRTQAVARERRRSASERLRACPPVACDASHAAARALRRRRINMGRQIDAGLRPCSNLHRHRCAERAQRRACLDAGIRRCRASIASTD